jgi:arylsulfatase A-like enzyme
LQVGATFLFLFAVAGSAKTSVAQADEKKQTSRPNIVFILTDDQRFDALGAMGNEFVRTPHLDALAKQGVLFSNMFCTTSICATSRASFLSGQWERRHKIDNFRTPLTAEQFQQSFPSMLRENGYHTGFIGKWGLGGPLPKNEYDVFRGFSGQGRYFPKGESGRPGAHQTHRLGVQALEFLETCTAERPFLLQLYTKAAHCQDGDPWPFQPDPRYNDLFVDVSVPLPATATEEHFNALPPFLRTSEARKRWFVRFASPELFQKSVKDYYRLVAGIDDTVGMLVNGLIEKQLVDNTIIIFTSDNGFYLGERGLAGKWFMHEESIRLPLVIYDPRLPEKTRGRNVSRIALNVDVAPTILDLAGIDIPASMQGRSLQPLLADEQTEWREDFLYEHRFTHPQIPTTEGVRTGRWKYTRYTSIDPVFEELFDLQADPREERNLADDPQFAKQKQTLRDRWTHLTNELR